MNDSTFTIPLSSSLAEPPERPFVERPAYIEQLRAEARGVTYRPRARKKPQQIPPDPYTASRLFTVETGSRWMELGEREPEAKMLFGEFWHQGELCILFADTNAGKTVLAVQIATNIARAKQTGPFACDAKPEKVLYVDFELTTAQFYQRYSHPECDYRFPANFFRAQFNPESGAADNFNGYDNLLIAGLEHKIRQVGATVLVIDNISCLRGGTESATVALRLMNNLKSLKADYKMSILVLAHTPKRNPARPLSADDLHGSKLLINFADSAFAIGKSTTNAGLCYLKQIKQRNTQQIYGEDNVALCRISKEPVSANKPCNFLHFDFEGHDAERPHILAAGRHGYDRSQADHQMLAAQIAALSAEGLSQRQIALQLNIGLGTVNKLLRRSCPYENQDTVNVGPSAAPDAEINKHEHDIGYLADAEVPSLPVVNEPGHDAAPVKPCHHLEQSFGNTGTHMPQDALAIADACANDPP